MKKDETDPLEGQISRSAPATAPEDFDGAFGDESGDEVDDGSASGSAQKPATPTPSADPAKPAPAKTPSTPAAAPAAQATPAPAVDPAKPAPATPPPATPPVKTAVELAEERAAQRAATDEQQEREQILVNLEKDFPDVRKTVASSEFMSWLIKQPRIIQDQAMAGNEADARDVMSKYQAQTKGDQSATPMAGLDLAELGKLEFEFNGQKVKIADAFKDEEGFSMELLAAIATLANHINQKSVSGLNFLKPDALAEHNKLIDSLKQEVAKVRFYKELTKRHADAEKIEDTDEYRQFVADSSEGIKRLAVSWDPEEVALVMDAFKEKTAKTANADGAAAAAKNKTRKDNIHSEALQPGASQTPQPKQAGSEFNEAFEDESAD